MRLDRVLLCALALIGGATFVSSPVAAGVTAIGIAILLFLRLNARWSLALTFVAALGALRARHGVEQYRAAWEQARDRVGAPKRCVASGGVESSPMMLDGVLSFSATLDHVECEGRALDGSYVARLAVDPMALGRGDRFNAIGDLGVVELYHNAELPSAWPGAARRRAVLSGKLHDLEVVAQSHGLVAWIDRARAFARARITATYSPAAEPFARALVLGEGDLEDADQEAFRRAGLLHILAVSGTHLVFAVVAAVKALEALLRRIESLACRVDVSRPSAFSGALLALLYADFAGGSGSAQRAAYMLCAGFIARAVGRTPHAGRTLGLSLLTGAVLDPLLVFDVSFLLSAAATAGLLFFGPKLRAPCAVLSSRVARFVAESVATTVSSMLPCAPFLALLSPELSLSGVFANLIAAPFGETISLPLCLVHPLLAPFPALERGVALVASGALICVKQIAHEASRIDDLIISVPSPSAWHFSCLTAAGAAFFLMLPEERVHAPVRRALGGLCLVGLALSLSVVEGATRIAGATPGRLRLTALDIGQGDSMLVDFPDGELWLIDGGGVVGSSWDPGTRVILPILRARRRTRLDVVVLTHPHPDHFTGLVSVLRHVEVGELWDSGQGEAEGAGPVYADLLAEVRAHRIRLRRPRDLCGNPRRLGSVRVDVFGPCPDFTSGRGANDNSLVIRLEDQAHSALLTGDAEASEEAELVMRYGTRLHADFLKVGHHGSRTSSTDGLLEAVRPELATISSGVRNRFGHPHVEALTRLAGSHVLALRLDQLGSVAWSTDGRSVDVRVSN